MVVHHLIFQGSQAVARMNHSGPVWFILASHPLVQGYRQSSVPQYLPHLRRGRLYYSQDYTAGIGPQENTELCQSSNGQAGFTLKKKNSFLFTKQFLKNSLVTSL